MAAANISKDLNTIKTKIAFGLTKRQLICFSLAGIVGIPFYLLTRKFIGNDIAVIFMILLMSPFFMFAMYEKNGQPLEKILKNYIYTRLSPTIRIYKTQNLYNYLKIEKQGVKTVEGEKKKTATRIKKKSTTVKKR